MKGLFFVFPGGQVASTIMNYSAFQVACPEGRLNKQKPHPNAKCFALAIAHMHAGIIHRDSYRRGGALGYPPPNIGSPPPPNS